MDVNATGGASSAAAYYQAASSENLNTQKADNAFLGEVKLRKPDGTIVTGTAGNFLKNIKPEPISSLLSPEMLLSFIKNMENINNTMEHRVNQMQAKGSSDVTSGGALPTSVKNGLDDIASDPAYAAKRARQLGTFPQLNVLSEDDFPKNGDPDSVWNEFHTTMVARMELTGQITRARSNYYHDMVAQDIPPAEIYAKLLEFNANLPKNSGNSEVLENTYSVGGWDSDSKSQYEYLMKALKSA